MPPHYPLTPYQPINPQTTAIRRIYIQNLTDLLHACLLRGDVGRAKRAWAILIRCREVDWRSRWHWGLLLLSAQSENPNSGQFEATQTTTWHSQADYEGRDVERWLKTVRVSAKEEDKPSLLHALVLHMIKHERFRHALEELETYLPSYPFLLSAPLHTYAGLLAFYLAQPLSARASQSPGSSLSGRDRDSSSPFSTGPSNEPADAMMLRQARGWFVKALGIDGTDGIAQDFIRLIDNPSAKDADAESEHTKDEDDSMADLSASERDAKSDGWASQSGSESERSTESDDEGDEEEAKDDADEDEEDDQEGEQSEVFDLSASEVSEDSEDESE